MLAKKFFINTSIDITRTIAPTPAEEIILHTITLPLQISVFLTHCGDKRSPFFRLTHLLPSDPKKFDLDSSQKWTIFHCFFVQRICSVAKSRRTFWFFFEIKGLWHGIRVNNFSLFNVRETVFLEIGILFTKCTRNRQCCIEMVF